MFRSLCPFWDHAHYEVQGGRKIILARQALKSYWEAIPCFSVSNILGRRKETKAKETDQAMIKRKIQYLGTGHEKSNLTS